MKLGNDRSTCGTNNFFFISVIAHKNIALFCLRNLMECSEMNISGFKVLGETPYPNFP